MLENLDYLWALIPNFLTSDLFSSFNTFFIELTPCLIPSFVVKIFV